MSNQLIYIDASTLAICSIEQGFYDFSCQNPDKKMCFCNQVRTTYPNHKVKCCYKKARQREEMSKRSEYLDTQIQALKNLKIDNKYGDITIGVIDCMIADFKYLKLIDEIKNDIISSGKERGK